MAGSATLTVREARERLSQMLDEFRNGETSAVFIGSHRRQEAVLIPVETYDRLMTERDVALSQALASVRAEGLEPTDEAHAIMEQWRSGEITGEQMTNELVRLYRRA